MSGWIKLHRQIQQHWLWQDKPFDRRSAWIDLLLMANHAPGKVVQGNEVIEIDRGERITSEVKLAERWGWSRKKVRNFLQLLASDGMIEDIKEARKRTRIKVCNYRVYQDSGDNERTAKEQGGNNAGTSEEQGGNINKNDKKNNNDKERQEDIYILTADEERFLATLKQVENYPLDREKDLEMYRTLAGRYSELDLNEAIEQWRMYKLDKPLEEKSNPRSQINTSFKNYVKWGRCLKGDKDRGKLSPAEKDYSFRFKPEPERDYTRGLPGY